MVEKNTLSILESIKKKIQKFDEPRKKADIGSEFDYTSPIAKEKPLAQEAAVTTSVKKEEDIMFEQQIESSFLSAPAFPKTDEKPKEAPKGDSIFSENDFEFHDDSMNFEEEVKDLPQISHPETEANDAHDAHMDLNLDFLNEQMPENKQVQMPQQNFSEAAEPAALAPQTFSDDHDFLDLDNIPDLEVSNASNASAPSSTSNKDEEIEELLKMSDQKALQEEVEQKAMLEKFSKQSVNLEQASLKQENSFKAPAPIDKGVQNQPIMSIISEPKKLDSDMNMQQNIDIFNNNVNNRAKQVSNAADQCWTKWF